MRIINLNKHMIFFFKLSPTLLCVDLRAVCTANAGDEAIAKTGRQKEKKVFQNHQMYLNRIHFRFWSHINPKIPSLLKSTQDVPLRPILPSLWWKKTELFKILYNWITWFGTLGFLKQIENNYIYMICNIHIWCKSIFSIKDYLISA